jgi:multiple sugar transport system substrate-binding protein
MARLSPTTSLLRVLGGAVCGLVLLLAAVPRAAAVEIEYWQYTFKQRVDAIDALIRQFEQANPGITVKQVTVPYDNYRTRIAAAIPAGEGPDVTQLFYGWLGDYIDAKLLQPLPAPTFDTAAIDREFFPFVQGMKVQGQYYALPTAVRSLALFWNRKLFQEAGLDPDRPPATLADLVEVARKTTRRNAAGNLLTAGIALDTAGQDVQWIRQVLVNEFGGAPYSADGRKVTYDSPAGVAAVQWYVDLIGKEKVSELGFLTDGVTAFRSGHAAMTIDGSFRLGAFDGQKGLDYGVAELPGRDGVRSNFASYWVNGITAKAKGEKLAAAAKFLAFITTPAAMQLWMETVGELPARVALAQTDAVKNHPKYGPFVRGLSYAVATDFVDESIQRQIWMDLIDTILLKQTPAATAVAAAAAAEQKVLDRRK